MTLILAVLTSKLIAALSSTAILYLIFSAEIQTAPDSLPTLTGLAQWLWTWQVHAARMFLNMRNPPVTAANTTTVTDVRAHSVSVELPNADAPDAGRKETK
jgi:hypothetical protein